MIQSEVKKFSSKKIKIIRTQSRIVVGGPALHTILLSMALSNEEYETILVGGGNNPTEKNMKELAESSGVPTIIIPEMGREIHFYDDIVSFFKLYKLIRKEKPFIIHTHTAKAGAIGRMAAFIARVPIIFHTFHGHVFYGYFNRLKTFTFILLEKILSKISTCIIVISQKQKQDIVETYKIAKEEKVVLIPLGFDWRTFLKNQKKYNFRDQFSIPKDKFLIGIVGRIVPIKDHFLFIEIANILHNKYPDKFHFVIIGDGELRPTIEDIIRKSTIFNSVTITGWLDLNKSIYEEINLLLLTSKNEGTPVAIIEALISGTHVIASNVGGVSDIMREYNTNNLIKGRDPNLYVKKIIDIYQNTEPIPKYVQEKIKNLYSSERLINDIKVLYEKKIDEFKNV